MCCPSMYFHQTSERVLLKKIRIEEIAYDGSNIHHEHTSMEIVHLLSSWYAIILDCYPLGMLSSGYAIYTTTIL
jgi:hypothetical protein